MLISALKIKFIDSLRGVYPPQEISTFFNWLTQEYLNLSRLDVALAPDKEIALESVVKFEEAIRRLLKEEPIQYIIGETSFYGLPIKVNKHVLIPRPETEELVEWMLSELPQAHNDRLNILDIGTGSGCIAIALAKELPNADVTAIDLSIEALKVARENAKINEVSVTFLQQDVLSLQKWPSRCDIIVSNPPYVRKLEKNQMRANVVENEPGLALWVEDEDPLVFYDRIASLASSSLFPSGKLFLEINEAFGQATAELVGKENFSTKLRKDMFGKDRMLMGHLRKNS